MKDFRVETSITKQWQGIIEAPDEKAAEVEAVLMTEVEGTIVDSSIQVKEHSAQAEPPTGG